MSDIPEILNRAAAAGYRIFTNGAYNVNIIGVRTVGRVANKFDDFLHLVYKDDGGNWIDHKFSITTDAGTYWLENPSRVDGTASLVAGQYRGADLSGLHRGQYTALVQHGAAVKVYRDANRDNILDHDPESITSGYFGINIHRANASVESTNVEKWSAGCQVFKKVDDYNKFMQTCKDSAKIYGNSFTYTLIDEKDLRKHLDT